MANLTNAQKERLTVEFVKYVDSQTVEDIIRDKKIERGFIKKYYIKRIYIYICLKNPY